MSREDHSLNDNLTDKQSTDLGKKREGDLNLKFPPQSTLLLYLGTLFDSGCMCISTSLWISGQIQRPSSHDARLPQMKNHMGVCGLRISQDRRTLMSTGGSAENSK